MNEIAVSIEWGELILMISTETAYSPDIADDLIRRATKGFREAMQVLDEYGVLTIPVEPVEDET